MQVRLLGPVEVAVGGSATPVPGLRRKAVLAVLALRSGQVVSTDRLIDIVWGDAAPATAANTLQSHVSYLRRILGTRSAIVARAPGYVLAPASGGTTDVEVAERLIQQAARSGEHVDGVQSLQSALALWRGPALADVTGLAWLDEQAHRLDQLRLHARKTLAQARLALGEHTELVTELTELAQEQPFDEQVHEQLMLALYRSGRQPDALTVYHQMRRTLNEEMGMDPGQRLRELEEAILRQDPVLDGPATTIAVAPGAAAIPDLVPAQLPAGVPAFAGRDAELAHLDAILARGIGANRPTPATVVISAVSGTAGVGKRIRPERPGDELRRCTEGVPGRAGRAAATDPRRHGRPDRPVPQPARRAADADRAGQRP